MYIPSYILYLLSSWFLLPACLFSLLCSYHLIIISSVSLCLLLSHAVPLSHNLAALFCLSSSPHHRLLYLLGDEKDWRQWLGGGRRDSGRRAGRRGQKKMGRVSGWRNHSKKQGEPGREGMAGGQEEALPACLSYLLFCSSSLLTSPPLLTLLTPCTLFLFFCLYLSSSSLNIYIYLIRCFFCCIF